MINNEIYITDQTTHKCIFCYNNKGIFINSIGHQWNGPENYLVLTDFIVHGDTVDILSSVDNHSTITDCSKDGIYFKTYHITDTLFKKCKLLYYFLNDYNKNINDYRLLIFDENDSINSKLLCNNTKIDIPIYNDNFFKINI